MAGATIEFDYRDAMSKLNRMADALQNPAPMLGEMGEALLDIHRQRFREQTTPDGAPWEPLKPWYQESKPRNKNKILSLDGYLSGTLRYQINGDELLFGTDRIYGAIHQFGGDIVPKSAGALSVGGRLVKKVTIPAREWLGVSDSESDRLVDIAKKHLNPR